MFERNRVDTAEPQRGEMAAVEITLVDGHTTAGKLVLPQGRRLVDFLNGDVAFLTFQTFEGAQLYLARTQIAQIKPLDAAPRPLHVPAAQTDALDPYAALGVAPGTPWDDVREAYRKLSLQYHPDRFAAVSLPPDVAQYLAAKARAINVAFRALERSEQARKATTAVRTAPIYEKPGTASAVGAPAAPRPVGWS